MFLCFFICKLMFLTSMMLATHYNINANILFAMNSENTENQESRSLLVGGTNKQNRHSYRETRSVGGPQRPRRRRSSSMYGGAEVDKALCVMTAILYWMRCWTWTFSQWRDFNSGLAWTHLRCWQMTRATLFWAICKVKASRGNRTVVGPRIFNTLFLLHSPAPRPTSRNLRSPTIGL